MTRINEKEVEGKKAAEGTFKNNESFTYQQNGRIFFILWGGINFRSILPKCDDNCGTVMYYDCGEVLFKKYFVSILTCSEKTLHTKKERHQNSSNGDEIL